MSAIRLLLARRGLVVLPVLAVLVCSCPSNEPEITADTAPGPTPPVVTDARSDLVLSWFVDGGAEIGSSVAEVPRHARKNVRVQDPTIPPEQLESLVAPIALYPDELLAQVLVASTYPLEIMQLAQWMEKHPDLEGEALAEAVGKEPWDPAIQSMAAVPEALERLANDIQWTTELGNAFLAQQGDVFFVTLFQTTTQFF